MAIETKDEVLEKILKEKRPVCPHCGEDMSLWEVPEVPVGDGLGWGTPFLYVCFNDKCPLYAEGWAHMREHYGRSSSYRCMCYPGTNKVECMPVFSPQGATGQIIDDEVLARQEALKEATKKGFSILAGCYADKDQVSTVRLLLDPTEPPRVRLKAAEIIGDIGDLEAIGPLGNYKFGNELLQKQVDEAIAKIHEKHFTRECPFCAEVIKKKAKICKHCGKEVAGL